MLLWVHAFFVTLLMSPPLALGVGDKRWCIVRGRACKPLRQHPSLPAPPSRRVCPGVSPSHTASPSPSLSLHAPNPCTQAFVVWAHMCVVRLFVEAILRYGLPPAFQAAVLQPYEKKEARLRGALAQAFGDGEWWAAEERGRSAGGAERGWREVGSGWVRGGPACIVHPPSG